VAELSVVIVTHNSAADLPECLGSLFEHQGDVDIRVVLSDSGSEDGSAAVAARFPVLFLPGENRGFAAANNRALAHTEVAASRYVLFLNPDTAILEGNLRDLIAYCERRPETGMVSVRQIDEGGKLIKSLFRFPSPARAWLDVLKVPLLRGHGHRIVGVDRYARDGEFDWAIGAFLLVRGEVLRRVGWFDERFFLTSEEVDLCRRAQAAGWRLRYVPALTIMHRYGNRFADPWRAWILSDHKVLYARKWLSRPRFVSYRAALVARFLSEALSPWRTPELRRSARFQARGALGLPGPSGPAGFSLAASRSRPAAPDLEP
jgi:N-acetylglucosaminyl-diphospho-decaprenol L-rhamnosyltransferase